MRITRTTYFFLLMLIMPVAVAAQVHISGKVLDSDSKPIEFATIRVAKSAIGTMSGIDGGYSLLLPAKTLSKSYSLVSDTKNAIRN